MGHEFHELTRIKFSTASDGFTAARGCADWGFTDEREAALPIVREILRALLSEFSRRTRPEFCTLEAPLECGSLLPPWFGAERGEESFRVKAQSSSEPYTHVSLIRHVPGTFGSQDRPQFEFLFHPRGVGGNCAC